MNDTETDERLREIVVRLIQDAPDPLPYSADRLGAASSADPISLEALPPLREPRSRWPILIGGLVAAAAFAAIAGFVIWDRTPNATILSATPEEPPNTASEEPVPFEPRVGVWSRVPHSNEVFGEGLETRVESVVAGGPGLVAVGGGGGGGGGGILQPPGASQAKVWTSVDGLEWTRVPNDEETFGGSTLTLTHMNDVAVGGPGLVAVGASGPNSRMRDDEVATVWTSVDGLVWTRVRHNEEAFGAAGGAGMKSVTAGGPGLVAVGWAGPTAAVWTSVDGLEWTRVPDNEEISGGRFDGMFSVTVGGPGLVAVGDDGETAAVWTSVDGLQWIRVPHNKEVFGDSSKGGTARIDGVAAGGPGLVAVGGSGTSQCRGNSPLSCPTHDEQTKAAVWTSVDGLEWTRVPHDEGTFGGSLPTRMSSVRATERGVVAVGAVEPFMGDGLGVVWTSVDGITWARVDDAESVFSDGLLSDVAVAGPGMVAVGRAIGVPQYSVAAIWTASLK